MNLAGIKSTCRALLFNRSFFTPHLKAHKVEDINFNQLHSLGIRHLVFDKDNTLTKPYSRDYISPELKEFIIGLTHTFGRDNISILSNSAGSSDDKDYAEAIIIEKELGLSVIRHKNKKVRKDKK